MKKIKKSLVILLLIIQLMNILSSFSCVKANIKEGEKILLQGDHECDSLLEFWMEDYQKWSYKIVWYVYYTDAEDGNKYPAFCVEPQKEGVGTGYDSYYTTITKENDNRIWRVLNKGYMGSNYKDWNLECDDDFYSATKVALHSLVEGIAPKDKYILGNRSVDGNTVEEIRRRGEKVLNVSQALFEYGINGTESYVSPKVSIKQYGEAKTEKIGNISYYVQNYKVEGNKTLKSYDINIQNFPKGSKILNSNNQEVSTMQTNYFKVAIPIKEIKENIDGKINILNANIKTNPIYYCNSGIPLAQNYVTYTSGYEKASTNTSLKIVANTCNLSIQKIDKETKEPIANVIFEIKNETGEKIKEVITNKNGIAELKEVNPQTVTIKEIKVPEPYILSKEEKKVQLEWGKTATVLFENERKKGNLKILKVDKDNNEILLEGVEFELLDSKGNVVKKIVTNSKGEAYITDLEIGNYTLRETKTKEGYYLAEDKKVEIKWNETKIEKIENKKQKGQIEVYKIDKEDKKQKLEGVIFEVLDENKKRIETIITNKEGYAITSKLPIGIYYLKEIKTQNKYLLNQDLIKVEVKKEEVSALTITNEKKKGQIEVYKVDKDNNEIKLDKVEFQVLDGKGNIVDKLITNENGYAITKKLPIGEYFIKEEKTNENYVLGEEKVKVEVEYGKIKREYIENEKIKGQIKIVKLSEDNNLINGKPKGTPLQNVVFEIRNEKGELIETLTTNEEGIAISKELEKGKYTIKEIKGHTDYKTTEKEFELEITEHQKIEEITITNLSKQPDPPKPPTLPRTGF